MNFSNYLNLVVALFIVYIGVYTFRIGEGKRVKFYFLLLCVLLAIWILAFAFRSFSSHSLRHIVLDWMLIPTIFFPIFLDQIVSLVFNPNYRFPKWKNASLCGFVLYFLWAALSCSFSIIEDEEKFSYRSTIHYHVLIWYCILYVGYSFNRLFKSNLKTSGDLKVRSTLMAFGILTLLTVSLILIYILPLIGIFLGQYTSIGVLLSVTIWAVAILQYNAFETKASILAGENVPILNRFSLLPVLAIYSYVDPTDFRLRSEASKAHVVDGILYSDLDLQLNSNLNHQERVTALVKEYKKYIK